MRPESKKKRHERRLREVCERLWPDVPVEQTRAVGKKWDAMHDGLAIELKTQKWPAGPRALATLLGRAWQQLQDAVLALDSVWSPKRSVVIYAPSRAALRDALVYEEEDGAAIITDFEDLIIDTTEQGGRRVAL